MKQINVFNEIDENFAKKLVSMANAGLIILGAGFIFMCLVSVFNYSHKSGLLPIIIVCVGYLLISVPVFIFFTWWPFRHVYADREAGQKIVEHTTIDRLQKVGFFEMQADSLLGIMAGAIYYLWIPDATRNPPSRRLRIGLTPYNQLMMCGTGSPIEISYLPKSGIIISIDTPYYRYAAYESSDKRNQYKQ